MESKLYPLLHQLLITKHTTKNDFSSKEMIWYWDVYSVSLDEKTSLVRCSCTSFGRDVHIPWFEVTNINPEFKIKEVCTQKMLNTIG
ncbi:hypothetical protein [Psychrobacillus sp. FSL K6-1267]|uniref:hypothetical protein n=1 Tax=Psychrobacillus sp. FSL K6-1267 TaxID=2921543 RepID=UPI0030F6482B